MTNLGHPIHRNQDKHVFIPYTRPLLTKAQKSGMTMKQIREYDKMEMLRVRDVQDFESLIPNSWAIREFPPDSLASRENGGWCRGPARVSSRQKSSQKVFVVLSSS